MKFYLLTLNVLSISFCSCFVPSPMYGPKETGQPVVTKSLEANGNFGSLRIRYLDSSSRELVLNGYLFIVDGLKGSLAVYGELESTVRLASGHETNLYSYNESDLLFGVSLFDRKKSSRMETLDEIYNRLKSEGFVAVEDNILVRVKYYEHVDSIAIDVRRYSEDY